MFKRIIVTLASLTFFIAGLGTANAATPRAERITCGENITHSLRAVNDLLDCAGVGLYVTKDGVTLDLGDHRIDGTGMSAGNHGVYVTAPDVTVRGGLITQFLNGVVVLAPGAHIRNVDVSGVFDGINLSAGSSVVRGCTVTSVQQNGISDVGGTTNNTIADNVVSSSGSNGILLNGTTGALVTGNVIAWSGAAGIEVWDSRQNVLSGNDVRSSTGPGIHVEQGSTVNTLSGNRSYGNNADGILVEGEQNLVQSNHATSNTLAGISVSADATRLIGNTADENGFHGIYSSNPNVLLKNNVTNSNGYLNGQTDGDGLGISAPSGTRNSGNVAKDNDNSAQCFAQDLNCFRLVVGTG